MIYANCIVHCALTEPEDRSIKTDHDEGSLGDAGWACTDGKRAAISKCRCNDQQTLKKLSNRVLKFAHAIPRASCRASCAQNALFDVFSNFIANESPVTYLKGEARRLWPTESLKG